MLNINIKEQISKLKSQFQKEFKESNPFTKNSFIGAILATVGAGLQTIQIMLRYVLKQSFAHTAEEQYLKLQAQNRINELLPTKATGYVSIRSSKVRILKGLRIVTPITNILYRTIEESQKKDYNLSIESIVGDNGIIYVSCLEPHGLGCGEVLIYDSEIEDINGLFEICVENDKRFSIIIDELIESVNLNPTNSNVKMKVSNTIVKIKCDEVGEKGNIEPLSELKLLFSDSTIDSIYTVYNGLQGGRDEESLESYRSRYLNYLRQPQAYFNRSQTKALILEKFPKITNVYILDNYPLMHSIIFSVIDFDSPTLEVNEEYLEELKEYIMCISPIGTLTEAIEVKNVKKIEVCVSVTNIQPSTNSLQIAVKANIEEFFKSLEIGESATQSTIEGIIYSTIDYNSNSSVERFNLEVDRPLNPSKDELLVYKCEEYIKGGCDGLA